MNKLANLVESRAEVVGGGRVGESAWGTSANLDAVPILREIRGAAEEIAAGV